MTRIDRSEPRVLQVDQLDRLIVVLRECGYRTAGPTRREDAIVYAEIESAADLPAGWTDEQDGGKYRLKRRRDTALFGYAVGPHSWKKFLFPPALRLWSASRTGSRIEFLPEPPTPGRWAFLGVRPCELAAMAVQDKVFQGGAHPDPDYRSRRESAFLVAVNCGDPAGTCFCTSMGTGPRANRPFDLALTEVLDEDGHWFLLESGSDRGEEIAARLVGPEATTPQRDAAQAVTDRAARRMGRSLETQGLRELLVSNPEHPRWKEVAGRCLTCANCTIVCPTCFCTTVEDVTDLTGDHAERWRKWDSCFTMDFSYLHGGSVRPSATGRYRQWMTHKLATWHDQFDSSGCVGCGRCITWCPVGIDITEEARALRETDARAGRQGHGKP